MSEQELDNLIRDALLDAAESDGDAQDSAAEFVPSGRYQRQMRAMCRNPLQWARRKTRIRWKIVLPRVAVLFLAVFVIYGCVHTARAGAMQWVLERDEYDMVFIFGGEPASNVVPEYKIADLPEGFQGTGKEVFATAAYRLYENEEGDFIGFDYGFMHQGAAAQFSIQDAVVTEVCVNHYNGYYFEAPPTPDSINTLFWIDEEAGMYFMIDACMGKNEMLSLAESVSLAEM